MVTTEMMMTSAVEILKLSPSQARDELKVKGVRKKNQFDQGSVMIRRAVAFFKAVAI